MPSALGRGRRQKNLCLLWQISALSQVQGPKTGSERSFYRVLHVHGQLNRRGRAQLLQEARPVPRLRADGPNQVWSWDISYLPTSVKGIWLYLYLVVDIWSRKVVAWDVEQSESAELAAQLVTGALLPTVGTELSGVQPTVSSTTANLSAALQPSGA